MGVYKVVGNNLVPMIPLSGIRQIRGITTDMDGKYYVAVGGSGIVKYDPQTKSTEWITDSSAGTPLTHNWISGIFIDSANRLWIGYYGGLQCIDLGSGKELDLSKIKKTFQELSVYSFSEDKTGICG